MMHHTLDSMAIESRLEAEKLLTGPHARRWSLFVLPLQSEGSL